LRAWQTTNQNTTHALCMPETKAKTHTQNM
jgi:hypothetical protein